MSSDDVHTVLSQVSRSRARIFGSVQRRSRARHHRRRRVLAGVAFLVLAYLAVSALGGGSASRVTHRSARSATVGRPHAAAVSPPARPLSPAARLAAAENRAIDRTLGTTPFVRVAGAQHREIALTFDDGPGPYTPDVLAVLRREHVPATFFEVGVLERYFHVSTSAIVAAGDVIGDHTEAHAPMSRLSAFDQQEQLLEDATVIAQYGAPFPRLFRPPYGEFDATTLSLLRRYRMLMVLWTVDTNDYRRPGVKAIVHAAVSGARPGAIILLHDAGGNRAQTVAALPKIIAALRARGYALVTVPRLLLDNPAPAHQTLGALTGGGG